MSDTLRSKLIRLAHAKPSLRADLLPLLAKGQRKQAAENKYDLYDVQGWEKVTSEIDAVIAKAAKDVEKHIEDLDKLIEKYANKYGTADPESSKAIRKKFNLAVSKPY